MSPVPVDPDAARSLEPYLAEGERLQWAARPDEARFAYLRGWLVLMGLFWLAVSGAGFYGFATTLLSDEYAGMPRGLRIAVLVLAGAPFLAVGLVAAGGHVPLLRRQRKRIAYGLTDRRVLVVAPAFGFVGPARARFLPLEHVGDVGSGADDEEPAAVDVHDARGIEEPLRLTALAEAAGITAAIREAVGATRAKPC